MGGSNVMPGGWAKAFGGRLRLAIWQQGWPNPHAFAAALDEAEGCCTKEHVYAYLSGRVSPSAWTLAVMVRHLPDVNVRWLLTGQPKGDPAMRPERGDEEC